MQQFGRAYQLIIGNDKESLVIDSLTLSFDITKTITQDPNTATISVTNLSNNSRNLITSGKYDRVLFNAGYGNEMRTLFTGWIDVVENKRNGTDTDTVLTCNDGQKDYREARTAVTVAKGATDKDVVAQVLKDMPNTQKGSVTLEKDRKLPRGKALVGNTRDVLKTIAKNQDADWSIQDGKLVMIPFKSALANNEGFLIQEGTGMIGSPQKTSDGIEVSCLLNNVLRIGQLCRIKSILNEFDGDYKVTKLQMKGSNKGNDWTTVLGLQNGQFHEVQENEKK